MPKLLDEKHPKNAQEILDEITAIAMKSAGLLRKDADNKGALGKGAFSIACASKLKLSVLTKSDQLTENKQENKQAFKSLDLVIAVTTTKESENDLKKANQLLAEKNIRSPFLDFNFVIIGKKRIAMQASGNFYSTVIDEKKRSISLSSDESKNIIGQLVLGLETLHNNQLIHRDLKPHNILVFIDNSAGSRKITVKITDFDGIQQVDEKGRLNENINACSTRSYRAPEIERCMKGGKYTSQNLNHFKGDIYSLGCIVHDICGVIAVNQKADIEGLANLLKTTDVNLRPTIAEIKKNAFFGSDEKQRSCFFESLLASHSQEIYSGDIADGYLIKPHSNPGEVFNILPDVAFQRAYHAFQNLAFQFKFLNEADGFSKKKTPKGIGKLVFMKNIEIFLESFQNLCAPSPIKDIYYAQKQAMLNWVLEQKALIFDKKCVSAITKLTYHLLLYAVAPENTINKNATIALVLNMIRDKQIAYIGFVCLAILGAILFAGAVPVLLAGAASTSALVGMLHAVGIPVTAAQIASAIAVAPTKIIAVSAVVACLAGYIVIESSKEAEAISVDLKAPYFAQTFFNTADSTVRHDSDLADKKQNGLTC